MDMLYCCHCTIPEYNIDEIHVCTVERQIECYLSQIHADKLNMSKLHLRHDWNHYLRRVGLLIESHPCHFDPVAVVPDCMEDYPSTGSTTKIKTDTKR